METIHQSSCLVMALDLGQTSKPSFKDHVFMEKVGPMPAIILTLKQNILSEVIKKFFQVGIIDRKQTIFNIFKV